MRPDPDSASHDLQEVRARLSRIELELARLDERITRLDYLAEEREASSASALARLPDASLSAETSRSTRTINYIGQALIALAVAYLLRALTEAGLVARSTGIWVGLTYALAWAGVSLALGQRRGNRLAAWFAAVLTPILAFPLTVEAALRFGLWPASVAFAVLGGVAAVSLTTSIVNRQPSVAWIASLGAAATATTLMVGLRAYVAAELFFVALGIATLWLGYVWNWTLLRWPAALAADVVAVALVLRALNPVTGESPHAAMAVLLLLLIAYPASILLRTIVLNRPVVLFEMLQSLALLLMLRGALVLAPLVGAARPILGVSVLGLGGATVAAAVRFDSAHRAIPVNAYFYSALGVMASLVGSAILLDGAALAAGWAVMALVVCIVALRRGHAMLLPHALVFGVAAAVPSGLLRYATEALLGARTQMAAPSLTAVAIGLLLPALVWASVKPGDDTSRELRRAAATLTGAIWLWAAAGLVAGVALMSLPNASTLRTVALCGAGCAAAAAGRWPPLSTLAWAAYPFLAGVAVKLVAIDLRADQPLAIFVALAVYGVALIGTARLGRRSAA